MSQINPNINSYKVQPGFKAASALPFMPDMDYSDPKMSLPPELLYNSQHNDVPPVEIPDIYYSPDLNNKKSSIKDTIKKVDMLDVVVPWLEHPLLMLGTCLGISGGIDAFSNSCNKEYDKSILKKAVNFGDKLEKSKFIQNKKTQKGLGYVKTGWNKVKNLIMKNSVIRAMVETPSMPENSMPKNELLKTKDRILEQFGEILKDSGLIEGQDLSGAAKPVNVNNFRLSKEAIKQLEQDFGGKTMAEVGKEKFVSRHILKSSGFSEAEINSVLNESAPLKAALEKIRNMLGGSEKLAEIVEGKAPNAADEAIKICDKLKGIKLNKGTGIPYTNIKVLSNETGFQEIYNRLYSIGKGAETKTGQFLSKLLQKIHRGFTFGGGKMGVMFFVAPHIVHTLINTHKAENDEKVGTFMNGMISAVSWVFTFPLILKAIHALGGIQYAGMGIDKVNELKSKVAAFNQRVADGEFKSFADWRKARKEVKKEISVLRKVENQDFITKCLRKVSEFFKSDLLKLDRYKGDGFFKRFIRNTPANVKNFVWSAGRFGVFMFIGMPIVDKIITKCTNALFGKSYDDMYEEENIKAKQQQKEFLKEDLQNRMYEAQARKMGLLDKSEVETQEQAQNYEQPLPIVPLAEENTVTETVEANPLSNEAIKPEASAKSQEMPQTAPMLTTQENKKRDNYTYIPSQENIIRRPETAPINKYIPSQMPAKIGKVFDNSGLESALKRADVAEAKAIQILSGKFPN